MSKTTLNGKKYDLSKNKDRTEYWTKYAADKLKGKRIIHVEYLSSKEAEESMWYNRPLLLQLDTGEWLCPMRDDEGNDGGAMCMGKNTFPVLSVEDK